VSDLGSPVFFLVGMVYWWGGDVVLPAFVLVFLGVFGFVPDGPKLVLIQVN
jgi:hypothetical protein